MPIFKIRPAVHLYEKFLQGNGQVPGEAPDLALTHALQRAGLPISYAEALRTLEVHRYLRSIIYPKQEIGFPVNRARRKSP